VSPQARPSGSPSRFTVFAAAFGLLVLGLLGTVEIWQALNYDVIGWRVGGIGRTQDPVLFWISFGVSVLIAAPMWLAALFIAVIFALRLASTKAH
jgi:hypothetical protein